MLTLMDAATKRMRADFAVTVLAYMNDSDVPDDEDAAMDELFNRLQDAGLLSSPLLYAEIKVVNKPNAYG